MKKVVAISGGMDCLHIGHVRMIQEAKKLGDRLVIILNNDNWLTEKKGFVFMPEEERKEILESIEEVDMVIISDHQPGTKDMSICKELLMVRPNVFANGGDRKSDNIPEYELCEDMNIKMVFSVGGEKIQSSSDLVKDAKTKEE